MHAAWNAMADVPVEFGVGHTRWPHVKSRMQPLPILRAQARAGLAHVLAPAGNLVPARVPLSSLPVAPASRRLGRLTLAFLGPPLFLRPFGIAVPLIAVLPLDTRTLLLRATVLLALGSLLPFPVHALGLSPPVLDAAGTFGTGALSPGRTHPGTTLLSTRGAAGRRAPHAGAAAGSMARSLPPVFLRSGDAGAGDNRQPCRRRNEDLSHG
jgi:hypothetical protein